MGLRELFGRKGLSSVALEQGYWSVPVGMDPAIPPRVDLYEGFTRDYLSIYRSQPAVRQVVDFIARNVAQVPLKVYRRNADDDRTSLPEHPFAKFIKEPNDEDTSYSFLRDVVTDLCIYDVLFYAKLRGPNGKMIGAFRRYPDAVSMRGGDATRPAQFVYQNPDGSSISYARDDMFWLHGYGSRRGISPMETLRRILAEDEAAGRHREGLYRNGYRHAGVITRPEGAPPMSQKARDFYRASLQSRYTGGANAGTPLILWEGEQYSSDQFESKDTQYIEGRKFTLAAAAHFFNIAPQMLGLEGAPYASITEYNRQLYQNSLAPWLEFLTQGFEKQILPEFDLDPKVYVEFSLEAKLRGSFSEQAQVLATATWMTDPEKRAIMNLPPVVVQASEGMTAEELQNRVNAATALIRAGFEPEAAMVSVGLDPIEHLGLTPITLKEEDPTPPAVVAPPKSDYEDILHKFFERQHRQVKALKGRGRATLPTRERWDRELATDLRLTGLSVEEAERTAKAVNDSVVAALSEHDDIDLAFFIVEQVNQLGELHVAENL